MQSQLLHRGDKNQPMCRGQRQLLRAQVTAPEQLLACEQLQDILGTPA